LATSVVAPEVMLSGHGAGLSSMTGPSSMTTPAMTSYLDGSPLFEETLLVGAAADAEAQFCVSQTGCFPLRTSAA